MNAFIIFTVIILNIESFICFQKTNLLVDFQKSKHKNFVSKNNHVLGGLIFIIFWIITLFLNLQFLSLIDHGNILCLYFFFIIGLYLLKFEIYSENRPMINQ